MKRRPFARADPTASRDAERVARQKRWEEVELPRWKAEVRAETERRGLAGFMNDARWRALIEAVHADLPFPPGFQLKPVTGEADPEPDATALAYWGAWDELQPFFAVEWLRVVPRYRKHRGRLAADEIVDCTDAFRALLRRLRIPFREDGARTFWIFGYASADPATLTSLPETPT